MRTDNSPLCVSELNALAKELLESGIGTIRLRGEVSTVAKSQAGHYYFTLKDEKAEIRCALFRSTIYRNRIRQEPEQGKEVILEGRVTLYVLRGSYQFLVENMQSEKDREGELYQQFLQLKRVLEERGYFQEERKKAIPSHPHQVGIVSSPAGAAVHDIIRTFRRRNPTVRLLIYPTAVQGERAPDEISAAISLANQRKEVDVLLVSRGGGSLEDLAAFNSKVVADAIYSSEIPIVTGIGHQTDVSIADYVADKAMATPTAAAERISTPSIDEMLQILSNLESGLFDRISTELNNLEQRLDLAQRSLKHPEQRISDLRNQFRAFGENLTLLFRNSIVTRVGTVNVRYQQLLNESPAGTIEHLNRNLAAAAENLHRLTVMCHEKRTTRVESLARQLEAMNPQSTLNRGYAIIRNKADDSIVADARIVSQGDRINAQLAKGSLDLLVESVQS